VCPAFFDTIETSSLTVERARAVYIYDNRVHVIAAAGSVKTSVMVGRAAYAVHRGFTTPEKILLLAFNTPAAAELRERVHARFAAAGLPATA
jgi:DNA helicase-4